MKILTTSVNPQIIQVIPRRYPDDLTIRLRDDSTNEITTYALESAEWNYTDELWEALNVDWNSLGEYYEENGYLIVENSYSLVQDRFYDLELIDELGNVIYKDKIFCTNQDIDTYSVNVDTITWDTMKDVWNTTTEDWETEGVVSIYETENTYDNDYIII